MELASELAAALAAAAAAARLARASAMMACGYGNPRRGGARTMSLRPCAVRM